MPTRFSKATRAEAEAAIEKSEAYQARKGEKFLNTLSMYLDISSTVNIHSFYLGDKAGDVSENQAVSTLRSVAASGAYDAIKTQVSHFVENSKALVKVLDEVGKVHPFIQSVSYSVWTLSVISHLLRRSCSLFVQDGDRARNCSTRE